MYDSVLLPTDGSQEMAQVTEQAIELATLCDAELHVVHVMDERAYFAVPSDARDRVQDTLEADGESFTQAVANQATAAGLTVVREHLWGDPAAAILSYAVDNDIDVIVMGTHGRTGYERYLLGSVAEKVGRIAPTPGLAIAVGDTDQQIEDIATAPSPTTTKPQSSELEHDDPPNTEPDDTK